MIYSTHKLIASILLGAFTVYYLFDSLVMLSANDYPYAFSFFLCALIVAGAIVGIYKQNKILLYLGLILGGIQILDGVGALVLKYVFGSTYSISLSIVVALVYIYPVMIIYKTIQAKRPVRN